MAVAMEPPERAAPRMRGGVAVRLERLLDAIADPARRGRVVPLLLGGYVLVWTLYGAIAKGSQDIHFDMAEAVVWWREAPFGTPKHPPLSGWLAGLWFDLFPRQDWAFYLLAMVCVGGALWFAWRVMLARLAGDKLAVGLLMLTLVPFFNFQALKYNANTVMIPLWAFATWAFLRSFATRGLGWAALAGVAAALVMLGKYWGIFLLAGFCVAALIDRRRAAYFRSPAPWVSIAAGLAVLAPHLVWVAANGFETFGYALQSHRRSFHDAVIAAPDYLAGAAAYVILPLLIVALAARIAKGGLKDMLWPGDPGRRLELVVFAVPLILPMLVAIATRSEPVSLWAMGSMTLLPVVLLSSPLLSIPRPAARRTIAFAVAFPCLALAAAPVAALIIHRHGVENHMAHYRLLAGAAEQAWQGVSDAPLRLVGGEDHIINGVAFYAAAAPATYDVLRPQVTPWADAARIAREGIVWICPRADEACVAAIEARAAGEPSSRRTERTLARDYLGEPGKARSYVLIAVPPRR
jgi:4-amino-4-deoxy-L-arabinose transferase-like glycosyltransferase